MISRYLRGTGILYDQTKKNMTDDQQRHTKMKKLIRIELDKCNDGLWPHVCELKTTPQGYQRIESMVMDYAAKEGMPIGSALALIEQEFAHAKQ